MSALLAIRGPRSPSGPVALGGKQVQRSVNAPDLSQQHRCNSGASRSFERTTCGWSICRLLPGHVLRWLEPRRLSALATARGTG